MPAITVEPAIGRGATVPALVVVPAVDVTGGVLEL
jgi:hypothetical protein